MVFFFFFKQKTAYEMRISDWSSDVCSSDLSSSVIARAKSGLYNQMEVQRGLGVTDLLGWFEPAAEDWQASRDLLEMIDYRVDNLLEPTVLTGEYHLILCRNVLLYFPIELRRKVFGNL